MSIQLWQGGHFFSRLLPTPEASVEELEVRVDGASCIALPTRLEACHQPQQLAQLLQAAGCEVEGCEVVMAEAAGAVSYALTLRQSTLRALHTWTESHNLRLRITTPLSSAVRRAIVGSRHDKTVALRLSRTTAYIAISHQARLIYAEAVPYDSPEGLVALLAALSQKGLELRRADILLSPEEPLATADLKPIAKLLKRHFRRTTID